MPDSIRSSISYFFSFCLPTWSSPSSTWCATGPTAYIEGPWIVVLSLAAFIAVFKLRAYPIKVQDRVIRLEERLRLQALAPAAWHAQIYRLTEDQLIGLRFAADDEVVELAKQALEHNLTRKQIKERIKELAPRLLAGLNKAGHGP